MPITTTLGGVHRPIKESYTFVAKRKLLYTLIVAIMRLTICMYGMTKTIPITARSRVFPSVIFIYSLTQ